METSPTLETIAEKPNQYLLFKKMAAPQNCYEVNDSKRRRVTCRALSPIARNIHLRSPPLLPGPMYMDERDPQLLPHQLCVKDFRIYLLYRLSSPGLLSSVINSGCLSLNEKEEILCKVGVRSQMRKLMDILAYRQDKMLFDVFLNVIREMGFSSVYDAMQKRVHEHNCEL